MCDYCNCRSVALIDRLGEEHAALLGLGATVRTQALIGKLPEARRSLARLVAELDLHTRTEEVALFPALQESGMEQTAAELVDDHRLIEHLVSEAERVVDAEWPSIAIELIAVLTDHIHREEYDVFPAAVQLVAPARWDAVHEQASHLAGFTDATRRTG